MQCNFHINSLNGEVTDEVSLFTAVAKQQHQSMPTIEYTEDPQQQLRFKAFVSVNNRLVGVGIGQNKQQAKLEAHKHALNGMCEELYK
jgi:dsRNA-specific ribonuclease